jgi:hypothetical protein
LTPTVRAGTVGRRTAMANGARQSVGAVGKFARNRML